MRQSSKVNSIEKLFPLLSVEDGTLISKQGELTLCYKIGLPEVFTVTTEDYEDLNNLWAKSVRILPPHTILHKQDWFVQENYKVDFEEERTFMATEYERHFNERPYLNHDCYLFITMASKVRVSQNSVAKTLCKTHLVPKEMADQRIVDAFLDAVSQFIQLLSDSPLLTVSKLTTTELIGDDHTQGLIGKYLSLGAEGVTLEDIRLGANEVRAGDNRLLVHTVSDLDNVPLTVDTDVMYDKLSTDRSECTISFASSVGLFLGRNHIYNQYMIVVDGDAVKRQFEGRVKTLTSMAPYSRSNEVNCHSYTSFLTVWATEGVAPVRSHFNVMSWSDEPKELPYIRNEVGSAFASMDITARHNTIDAATLFWAGIPGNAADLPFEETFYAFPAMAACMFTNETNYQSSLSPFGIKLSDRISGKPLHLDISDLPMKKGITSNRNKFILGPSGSGKSFFTNHMVRQYYEQGSHVLIIDTGHSYEGLCTLINRKTKGEDGIYYTYSEEKPITFNPFYTEDYVYTTEKKESLSTLIMTLWKRPEEPVTKTEEIMLGKAISDYISKICEDRSIRPCFDTFFEFLNVDFREYLAHKSIEIEKVEFNLNNLLNTIEVYYGDNQYGFLLNSEENIDLLHKRFIIMEIDAIKDNEILLPIVTVVIMEAFINKMRRLNGVRKQIIIEEAWKAIASPKMANFVKYLYKTVRKHFGEAIVVTQDPDDILRSDIVREAIINNSDCKILLDQRKYMNKFEEIQKALGLTEKEKDQILSMNQGNDPKRKYKEVWIGLGANHSAVYATEVSRTEAYIYSTEQSEKVKLKEKTKECNGDIELAAKLLASE